MIELYSTETCPRCKILKERLKNKNIEFKENQNEEEMTNLGFTTIPMLKTDKGEFLDFGKAIAWINSL